MSSKTPISFGLMFAMALAGMGSVRPVVADAAGLCDRSCLVSFVDKYLAAMVAHDPYKAPFALQVKYSENAVPLPLDRGLWATADRIGRYRIDIDDPETEQAAYQGNVIEHGRVVRLALRLKIRHNRITEAEAIVARGQLNPNAKPPAAPDPSFARFEPAGTRASRAELIHDANLYWDGILRGDASIIPFAKNCNRIENGNYTTNVAPKAARPGQFTVGRLGCAGQINQRVFAYTESVTRRGWVVDVEKGLVFAFYDMNKPGIITHTENRNGQQSPVAPQSTVPSITHIGASIKIVNHRILRIEGIWARIPYGTNTTSYWDESPWVPDYPKGTPGAVQ